MTDQRPTEAGGEPTKEPPTIYDDEIRLEITNRRNKAHLNQENVKENLVGLAISGGGIRAGAIGLGILQGLRRKNKLRYFDYLSTVSGGGFAGAYLSSLAAAQKSAPPTNPPGQAGQPASAQADLPIVPEQNGCQSRRIIEFLDTSRKFTKPLVFLNRYLAGLLLNWVVIFSGLIAVAAGAAWLFRQIYQPDLLEYLSVLGFRDDLSVCMFPPLVLFGLWAIAWGVSYWKHGSRSTGLVARWLFFLLLVTTGVSFAAILGAGDIDAKGLLPSTQVSGNEAVNNLFSTVQAIVLTAVIAALLPYLNPLRLFRSGAPSAKPAERYIFAIASRALVFGVPFLVMSYFVQENISEWYEQRDGSVYRSEVRDWNVFDPDYEDQVDIARMWEPPAQTDLAHLFDGMLKRQLSGASYTTYFEAPIPGSSQASNKAHTRLENKIWVRWAYLLEDVFRDYFPGGSGTSSRFDTFVGARIEERDLQEKIAGKISERLRQPDFARSFLRDDLWKSPANASNQGGSSLNAASEPIESLIAHRDFASEADRKAWVMKLKAARENALQVGTYWTSRGPAGLSEGDRDFSNHERDRAISSANRKLIQAYYGDALEPTTTIFSGVVWEYDQRTRRNWFLVAMAIFVLFALIVDLNATSCHGYYAAQTAECWIEDVPGFGRDLPLSQLETTDTGRPYHLICGCVRLYGRKRQASSVYRHGSFLFSKLYCGSDRLKYKPTSEFEGGGYTLPDAIAASGGALSPTESNNPLSGVLLTLMNFRLGHWVENPAFQPRWPELSKLLRRWWFTPARWLWSLWTPAEERAYCLVTDGGYYENLGLEELLRRELKLIVAVDAGQDEQHQFEDFVRLVRRARMAYGIEFRPYDPALKEQLLKNLSIPQGAPAADAKSSTAHGDKHAKRGTHDASPPAWTKSHFVPLQIVYRDGRRGVLIYVKSSLTGDEPLEILQYQRAHPMFPHTPTSEHLLQDADQFLSYVMLGCHMAEDVAAHLPEGLDTMPVEQIEAFIAQGDFFNDYMRAAVDRFQKSERPGKGDGESPWDDPNWFDNVIRAAIQKGPAAQVSTNIVAKIPGILPDRRRELVGAVHQALRESTRKPIDDRVLGVRSAIVSTIMRWG